MIPTWSEAGLNAGEMPSTLSPYQRHLLMRLHHQIDVAAPAAVRPWQQALVAHAVRRTLDDCRRAGLDAEATALLRRRGRLAASGDQWGASSQCERA